MKSAVTSSPAKRLQLFALVMCLALFWSALSFVPNCDAAQVSLSWDANTEPELSGYKIYYGTESRNYSFYYDVGNATTLIIPDLVAGQTYYIAATAYDTSGMESDYSNEISIAPSSSCTYSITPANQTFGASGGTGTIAVATQSSCNWIANGGSWVIITSGAAGTGNGTVTYSVAANTSTLSRVLATSIAGRTMTVTQEGAASFSITASAGTGGSISPSGVATVSAGANKTYTIAAVSGYSVGSVVVDGTSLGKVTSYTFSNVTANHTISAAFVADTYTLTVTKMGDGTVTTNPSGTNFTKGTTVTLSAAAASGSTFGGWTGACAGTNSTCQVTMNSNLSAGASFSTTTYSISASAGTGGSISPSGVSTVSAGTNKTYTIAAASGYSVGSVAVDGTSVGKVTSYTFSNVTANHTISAAFVADTYTLTVTKMGDGTVTTNPSGTNFTKGTTVTLSAAAASGSKFAGWSGACSGKSSTCLVTVNSNLSVGASFTANAYVITASAGKGGSISPTGASSVMSGGSLAYTITPADGYEVGNVTVDGASVGKVSAYSFSNVTANHSISAAFVATTYALSITKTGEGIVTTNPSGGSFTFGTVVSLTASAAAGSAFSGWSGACSGTSTTCQVTMNGNLNVGATFISGAYTITAAAGTGGSISPSGSTIVTSGGSQSYSISPNSGYTVSDVTVDGMSIGQAMSFSFNNVTANHTIKATFSSSAADLKVKKSGNGSGTVKTTVSQVKSTQARLGLTSASDPSETTTSSLSTTTLVPGTVVTLTAKPEAGSKFTGWAGACSGANKTCKITVNGSSEVEASFVRNSKYTITARGSRGGTVSPKGKTKVLYGEDQTITYSANAGYKIDYALIDGEMVYVSEGSYTFSDIQKNHDIKVAFVKDTAVLYALQRDAR